MILRWRSLTALLILFAGLCAPLRATMTVGWKIPLEWVEGQNFDLKKTWRKLDQPPGPSAFFQPGDELWDLTKVFPWPRMMADAVGCLKDSSGVSSADNQKELEKYAGTQWTGEWLVWDARAGMIVARGTRNEILSVERALDLKNQIHLASLKLERVDRATQASRGMTVVSRPGEPAHFQAGDWEADVTLGPSSEGEADLNLSTSWEAKEEGRKWNLETDVYLADEERTLLARSPEWELWGTFTILTVEGIPYSQQRWVEEGGKLNLWPNPARARRMVREEIDGNRVVTWFDGPLAKLGNMDFQSRGEAPADLAPWVHGAFGKVPEDIFGPETQGMIFSGIDPLADAIVWVQRADAEKNPGDLDSSNFCPPTDVEIRINDAAGGWYLALATGTKASISLGKGDESEQEFEIRDAAQRADNSHLDIECTTSVVSSGKIVGSLSGTLTVMKNQPSRIGAVKPLTGEEIPVEATADFREIYK